MIFIWYGHVLFLERVRFLISECLEPLKNNIGDGSPPVSHVSTSCSRALCSRWSFKKYLYGKRSPNTAERPGSFLQYNKYYLPLGSSQADSLAARDRKVNLGPLSCDTNPLCLLQLCGTQEARRIDASIRLLLLPSQRCEEHSLIWETSVSCENPWSSGSLTC